MSEKYEHYSMEIQWSEPDNTYIVTVPELPGLKTHGDTYEEAVKNGREVTELWIDANEEWGQAVPKPRVLREAASDDYISEAIGAVSTRASQAATMRADLHGKYEHYSMQIQWSEPAKTYLVTVPELPGCITHGDTYEDAVKQGRDAIKSWINASIAWGQPIPAPKILKSA